MYTCIRMHIDLYIYNVIVVALCIWKLALIILLRLRERVNTFYELVLLKSLTIPYLVICHNQSVYDV